VSLVVAACGGTAAASAGCAGLPTARHTREFLVLFGALSKLNKRFLCSQLGKPTSIRSISRGREFWTYGGEAFTLRGNNVIAHHAGRTSIGG
jgi:hypothetical protein